MLPDGRIRLNRSGVYGEKRPVLVGISEDVPLKILTTTSSPAGAFNPSYRLMNGETEVIALTPVDGFTDPESPDVLVWWYPDLESVEIQALADGSYDVEFRFEARAAGEDENRRYVRSVGIYIG